MVSILEEAGLDPKHIERRISFILQRSDHHQNEGRKNSVPRAQEMACVGTLLRDAACLALLLEEDMQAKDLLQSAGKAWADIGLFSGYALLRLSGDTDWAERYANDLNQAFALIRLTDIENHPSHIERPSSLSEAVEARDGFASSRSIFGEKPHLEPSVSSKRQLLNLLQASAAPKVDVHALNALTKLVRHRLSQEPSSAVDGMRLHSYVSLLDAFSSGEFGSAQRNWLTLMVLNRAERLAGATDDTYHWERILNPAFVIDLDLMTLCVYAAENELTGELDNLMGGQSPLVSLPWTIAKRLVKRDPRPEFRFR